ncbi:hypothetical protein ACFSTC_56140 [Nonomuraea ferruginea]
MRWLFVLLGGSDPGRGRGGGRRPARRRRRTPPVRHPTGRGLADARPADADGQRVHRPLWNVRDPGEGALRRHRLLDHPPTSNPCTWRSQLQEIHRVGGDTVIRIGYGLQFRTVDRKGRVKTRDGEVDSLYKACEEDGVSCYESAERDLKEAHPDNRIGRVYVYRTDESFGDGLFRCQPMERSIDGGKRTYFRLIAPPDGSDDPTCDFSKGSTYDLILIAGSPEDSLTKLLDLGDQFGVQVFPALPLAPRDPASPIRANRKHIGTLTTVTRRILQDYGARFAERQSLGGVYQPFEVQMADTLADNPTLEVYADQHRIVRQELPGKPILISPYLDARKRVAFGQTPRAGSRGLQGAGADRRRHHRPAGQPRHRQGRPLLARRARRRGGRAAAPPRRRDHLQDRLPRLHPRLLPRDGGGPRGDDRGRPRRAALGQRRGLRAVGRRALRGPRHPRQDRQEAARPGRRHGGPLRPEDRLVHVERLHDLRVAVGGVGDHARLAAADRGRRHPPRPRPRGRGGGARLQPEGRHRHRRVVGRHGRPGRLRGGLAGRGPSGRAARAHADGLGALRLEPGAVRGVGPHQGQDPVRAVDQRASARPHRRLTVTRSCGSV